MNLKEHEKQIDALRAEVAETQKQLELTVAKIRDRESSRDALAVGKSDAVTMKEYNRLGKEIEELKEQVDYYGRRLILIPGQVKQAEQERNAALAGGIMEQIEALGRRFDEVKAQAVKKIADAQLKDYRELKDLKAAFENLVVKYRALNPGVQAPSPPELVAGAVYFIKRLAQGIDAETLRPE